MPRTSLGTIGSIVIPPINAIIVITVLVMPYMPWTWIEIHIDGYDHEVNRFEIIFIIFPIYILMIGTYGLWIHEVLLENNLTNVIYYLLIGAMYGAMIASYNFVDVTPDCYNQALLEFSIGIVFGMLSNLFYWMIYVAGLE